MEEFFDTTHEIPHFVDDPKWDRRWFEEESSKHVLDTIARLLREKPAAAAAAAAETKDSEEEVEDKTVDVRCLINTHGYASRRSRRFADRLRDMIQHHRYSKEKLYHVSELEDLSAKDNSLVVCQFLLYEIEFDQEFFAGAYKVDIRPTPCIQRELRGIGPDMVFLIDYLPSEQTEIDWSSTKRDRPLTDEEILHNVVRPLKEVMRTSVHLVKESRTNSFDKSLVDVIAAGLPDPPTRETFKALLAAVNADNSVQSERETGGVLDVVE